MDDVMIRRARPDDAGPVAAFARDAFVAAFAHHNAPENMAAYVDAAFAPATVAAEITADGTTYLLAERGAGRLVGYAKLRREPVDPAVTGRAPIEIERIYASPDAIGRGIGSRLLQACLAEAETQGRDTIWLGVWEHNTAAIAFYRRWGFEVVGTHDFWLGDEQQTDHVMQRAVTTSSS